MRSSHVLSRLTHSFDEPNLVSHGGLSAAGMLAQRIGLDTLVASTVTVPGPCGANIAAKVATVLGAMLAGADSIEDLDVLRAGATPVLLNDLRAPSTIGSCLRSFTLGNVRQLDAVSRQVRVRLWAAGVGPHRLDGRLFIDADSTIAQAYGPAKQGVSFGYTKVRGYHPLIAAVTEPGNAPDVLHTPLREGKANTARGAASFVAESFSRVRAAAAGELVLRADGGFYNHAVVNACVRAGARFSITVRADTKVRQAIADIPEEAWTPIPYWSSHTDPDTGQVIDSQPGRRRDHLHRVRRHQTPGHRPPARAPGPAAAAPHRPARTPDRHLAPPRHLDRPDRTLAHRRGRAPRPRHHRAGHRRPEEQRHGPPTLRVVHRQRRLAGPGRPDTQPHPRPGDPGRVRPRRRDHRNDPPDPDRHPRPAGPLRTPLAPANARTLALATALQLGHPPHPGHPATHLISRPPTHDPGTQEAGRPAPHAHNHIAAPRNPNNSAEPPHEPTAVDPG